MKGNVLFLNNKNLFLLETQVLADNNWSFNIKVSYLLWYYHMYLGIKYFRNKTGSFNNNRSWLKETILELADFLPNLAEIFLWKVNSIMFARE